MQLITHQNHITEAISDDLLNFIVKRFQSLTEDSEDVPPIIILVKPEDDITSPDYAFIGPRGLLTDLWEEYEPQQEGYVRPFEWVSYNPDLKLYELLFLVCGENGYWILIPEDVVEMHPGLKWVLTSSEAGGLSDPQPL